MPTVSQEDQNASTLTMYQEFCNATPDHIPKLKEIITVTVKNLLDLSKSLVSIHSLINSSDNNLTSELNFKISNWHNEVISNTLSQRRSFSRLVSDLKYLVGSVEGADEIFLEIDDLTNPLKRDWSPSMSDEAGSCLRKNFLDLILIIDPEIDGGAESQKSDLGVIKERIQEVKRRSLSYLDNNADMFKGDQAKKMFINEINLAESGILNQNNMSGAKEREETSLRCIDEKNTGQERSNFSESKTKFILASETSPSNSVKNRAMNDVRKRVNFDDDSIYDFFGKNANASMKRNASAKLLNVNYQPLQQQSLQVQNIDARTEEIKRKIMKIASEPNLLNKENARIFDPSQNEYHTISKQEETSECSYVDKKNFSIKSPELKQEDSKFSFNANSNAINFESNHTFAPSSKKVEEPSLTRPTNNKKDPSINSKSSFMIPSSINMMNFKKKIRQISPSPSQVIIKNSEVSKIEKLQPKKIKKICTKPMISIDGRVDKNKNQHRIITTKEVTPIKSSLKPNMLGSVCSVTPNTRKFFVNETNRSRNLSTNRSHCSLNPNKMSIKRLRYSNQRSPITNNINKFPLSSTRRDLKDATARSRSTSRLQKPSFDVSRAFATGPLTTDRMNQRVYTQGGSQSTTPMRVKYNTIQVNSITPHRLPIMNEQFTPNSHNPIKIGVSSLNVNSIQGNNFNSKHPTFNINQFLGNRKSEKLHVGVQKVEKITLSNNGNYLLFGGSGLHVLDMMDNKFKLIRFDKRQSNPTQNNFFRMEVQLNQDSEE